MREGIVRAIAAAPRGGPPSAHAVTEGRPAGIASHSALGVAGPGANQTTAELIRLTNGGPDAGPSPGPRGTPADRRPVASRGFLSVRVIPSPVHPSSDSAPRAEERGAPPSPPSLLAGGDARSA